MSIRLSRHVADVLVDAQARDRLTLLREENTELRAKVKQLERVNQTLETQLTAARAHAARDQRLLLAGCRPPPPPLRKVT